MPTIIEFEDIHAWQKARELTKLVYMLTQQSNFKTDFVLINQIRKSAISIMSNIAEGFARRSDKEFANFLSIAHGSTAELRSQLYIALDQSYITEEQFKCARILTEEASKLIQGFSNFLRTQQAPKTHRPKDS